MHEITEVADAMESSLLVNDIQEVNTDGVQEQPKLPLNSDKI
jgi:hypothetical protein